ncbi:uncharacterized protein N7469_006981 [Penicillium citrinum]|uniref:Uncharacterized protein n=1 Tax=Penicillium citrinum TaxID=5077 RepID=A0A9W9NVQ4_PENCI|nr:uncharacterized protein N7469_006981 [Penicillium citrinum]KAJ5226975.1 hypothetical protein N7469_006981 [Penicillium citrinum]
MAHFHASDVLPLIDAVFELLIAVGLSILFIGYVVLKRKRGWYLKPLPLNAILASILFYIGSEICLGVYNVVYLSHIHMKPTYSAADPISGGLMLIAIIVLFYVFYATVYIFGEQIMGHSSLWARLKVFHWVLLGIFSSIGIVDFAWFVYKALGRMQYVRQPEEYISHYNTWAKIESCKWIVFWVGSWEILGALMLMGMRASTSATHMRMATYFALTAGSFFFALNGLWAIWSINSYLVHLSPTGVAIAAREVIQFFFCMGSFLGLGLCAWRFPAKVMEDMDSVSLPGVRDRTPMFAVEADSSTPHTYATELGHESNSDDVPKPKHAEIAASRPILEADSRAAHEKP